MDTNKKTFQSRLQMKFEINVRSWIYVKACSPEHSKQMWKHIKRLTNAIYACNAKNEMRNFNASAGLIFGFNSMEAFKERNYEDSKSNRY